MNFENFIEAVHMNYFPGYWIWTATLPIKEGFFIVQPCGIMEIL